MTVEHLLVMDMMDFQLQETILEHLLICNPLILLSIDVLDLAEYLRHNTWSEDFFVCGRLADHH
ncbi:hypothetical protein H5410_013905 [Solanum commersonii]|uniref:Uncharacterized protein n=1 Tax=Solanum commersonii TaxID=4109 RepID=A0A9J5ZPI2_SOLCO|nr:hypothetical protein H5410_013905 [Solanum commersonii]